MSFNFSATPAFAQKKDKEDILRSFRSQFHFPQHENRDAIYFCGNSLGLQPKNVAAAIEQELKDWQNLAVEGYYHAKTPWLFYQHNFSKLLAAIAGCNSEEVTVMNALTVNLHFMLLSFYRPSKEKYKIIMEAGAFPSDQYAVETQVRFYGFDPDEAIIEIHPAHDEKIIR